MACNIEIKAKATHPQQQREIAATISDTPCELIEQVDTFFDVPTGRLKLRRFSPDHAELIQYNRQDQTGPARSDYLIVPTTQPDALRRLLSRALPIRGVVSKVRHLYLVGQTRIHFDDVEDLGWFIELEVVLTADQSDQSGRAIADDLMSRLDIHHRDLIEHAYIDLLTAVSGEPRALGSEKNGDPRSNQA